MASTARTTPRDLELLARLEAEPHRFGFFHALRRLEAAFPDHDRLGQSDSPAKDPVRLGQTPSLAFAPSTLSRFQRGSAGHAGRLEVLFFGLFGPNGPLPHHLTDHARDRQLNAKDHTFTHFADIFHHRMLSLFYRAWANAQPTVSYDRPASDRFASYTGALFGLGMPSLQHRGCVADAEHLFFAGHLACQTRNAEGLEHLLERHFGVDVRIDEYVGQWVPLPRSNQCQLGVDAATATLGRNAFAGDRVWDRSQKFRVTLGPLDRDSYRDLLPGGSRLPELVELVRSYIHDEFVWDVRLILRGREVAPARLGEQGRLGWTAWLASDDATNDVDDLLFDPLTAVGEASANPHNLGV